MADRGHFTIPRTFPRGSGLSGKQTQGPHSGARCLLTCWAPHILPRHGGASRQGLHLLATALDSCTGTQCGLVVFLVLLFLQKERKCVGRALPSPS